MRMKNSGLSHTEQVFLLQSSYPQYANMHCKPLKRSIQQSALTFQIVVPARLFFFPDLMVILWNTKRLYPKPVFTIEIWPVNKFLRVMLTVASVE